MNFYALFSILFVYLCKVASTEKKVEPLDLIFIVNITNLPLTTPIILATDRSFVIPAAERKMFFSRVILGYILIVSLIIGNILVPVTVQQTLANTTPFWAALISYCYAGERLLPFEIVAMAISLGGVALVTIGQAMRRPEEPPQWMLFSEK